MFYYTIVPKNIIWFWGDKIVNLVDREIGEEREREGNSYKVKTAQPQPPFTSCAFSFFFSWVMMINRSNSE